MPCSRALLALLLLVPLLPLSLLMMRNAVEDESSIHDLDSLVRKHLAEAGRNIIAFSAVGVKDGKIAWEFVAGLADHNKSEPVTPATRFMWCSVSKTVISYAVMLLVDRGIIGLDDDVSSHVGFAVRHPNFRDVVITLRMLMTHTASINDASEYFVLPETCVEGDDISLSNGAWLREYLTPGGHFYGGVGTAATTGSWIEQAPGSSYEYSNEGASLAALVAERAAQKTGLISPVETVSDLVRRHVFPALGVAREDAVSYFLRDLPSGPSELQRPSSYYPGNPPSIPKLEEYFVFDYPEYPCGRWEASPRDQAHLMINFINNGTTPGLSPLLNASTVAEMKRPQSVHPKQEAPQGLIWYYKRQGGRMLLGHDGCDWGSATGMFFNPATGAGYAVATSSDCENKAAYEQIQAIEIAIINTLEKGHPNDSDNSSSAVAEGQQRQRHGMRRWLRVERGAEVAVSAGSSSCKNVSLPKPCWWLCVDYREGT